MYKLLINNNKCTIKSISKWEESEVQFTELEWEIFLNYLLKYHKNLNYSGCNSGFYIDCSPVIIICIDLNLLTLHNVSFATIDLFFKNVPVLKSSGVK